MKVEVIEDWVATYSDPIKLRAGERISLTGKKDIWDGHVWHWAINAEGKEGWVPQNLVSHGRALEDYDAMELSCRKGEVLEVETENQGWAYCRRASGDSGWVPLKNLKRLEG